MVLILQLNDTDMAAGGMAQMKFLPLKHKVEKHNSQYHKNKTKQNNKETKKDADWLNTLEKKKKGPIISCLQETHLIGKDRYRLKMKG
jgi:hypothetical protein